MLALSGIQKTAQDRNIREFDLHTAGHLYFLRTSVIALIN
jgi:hypothetical protein